MLPPIIRHWKPDLPMPLPQTTPRWRIQVHPQGIHSKESKTIQLTQQHFVKKMFEKQDRRIYSFIMAHAISGVEDVQTFIQHLQTCMYSIIWENSTGKSSDRCVRHIHYTFLICFIYSITMHSSSYTLYEILQFIMYY